MIPVFEDPDCPVPIIQGADEFVQLLKLYKHVKPTTIVEIGSLFGGTLFEFMKHTPKEGIFKFVSIDLPVSTRDSRYAAQRYGHDTLWHEWATSFSTKKKQIDLVVLPNPSAWSVPNVVHIVDKIDFLFIDGDHSYNGVKLDWELYRPHIKFGGIVAFHDIYRHVEGVPQLWQEIKADGYVTREFSTIEDQKDWGIGVCFL